MLELNLPPCDLKISEEGDRITVLDRIRSKYVAFTPEENVRLHFVNYLTNYLHYPSTQIMNEVTLNLNGLTRRCDTVIFGSRQQPLVIAEYKSPKIAIGKAVFEQVVRYNIVLRVKYLIVSNGLKHYCTEVDYDTGKFNFLTEIPDYDDIKNKG